MKIRNHRKKEYVYYPYEKDKIGIKFFYKSDLMNYLTANIEEAVDGEVVIKENYFSGIHSLQHYDIWYNRQEIKSGANCKSVLKKIRYSKKRLHKISKLSKKHFAFSHKIITLMCYIGNNGITKNHAKNLVNLFYKQGFKDFVPNENDQSYIDNNINEIPFWYWADRCNYVRVKTIIENFKQNKLL